MSRREFAELASLIREVVVHSTGRRDLPIVRFLDWPEDGGACKKLVILIAVSRCCVSTEEFFLRTLSRDHVNSLREAHDGLNELMALLA